MNGLFLSDIMTDRVINMSAKKKRSLWWIIPVSVVAVLFCTVTVIGAYRWLKNDPLPEGCTPKHHSYEDMLEYARTIDPDATVSEDYTDTEYLSGKTIREWAAVINGIECHVASIPGHYLAKANSSFIQVGYSMSSDYSYTILGKVMENYPELGVWDGSAEINRAAYRCYVSGPTLSVVIPDGPVDREAFDELWRSYVSASREYEAYGPDREFYLEIRMTDYDGVFIRGTGEDQYKSALEEVLEYSA